MIVWDSESGNAPLINDKHNHKLDEKGNYAFIIANYPVSCAHYATILFHGPDAEEIAEKWNAHVSSGESVDYINETENELQRFMGDVKYGS